MQSKELSSRIVLEIQSNSAVNDVNDDTLDENVIQLIGEVRELDVQSAERLTVTNSNRGTKAGEAFSLGGLVVVLLPEVIKDLVGLVVDWVRRNPGRSIKIKGGTDGAPEYQITGAWKAEQLAEVMKALSRTDPSSKQNPAR